MVYRREAFKNYDYILSPAQHITRELKAMEERYGWPEKNIEDTGYARLDDLREKKSSYQNAKIKQILIAPSWGANGLIETGKALEISKDLIESGYKVIIQPHPMTCRKSPEKINEIRKKAKGDAGLELNSDITNKAPFFESAFLITDWSGTSYEFAFTHERPVLFIETKAPKCRNEDYKDIDIVPMEISIRNKIGKVLAPDECHKISDIFQDFETRLSDYQALIKAERDKMIFNLDESSVKARIFIMNLLSNSK
jgi:YidC/Oxa1 family membrane protein insertase